MKSLKTHVSLNVTNLEESVAFYRAFLGIEPVKLKSDYAKFEVSDPALNLALNLVPTYHEGGPRHLSHLGIQVEKTEDVLAAQRRFQEAGLNAWSEMATTCCYALQDKIWLKDPDGIMWEIFVVHVLDVSVPAAATTCCAPA